MFAIPQLITVPALASGGAMTIEWPTLGAFLAWTLIAALVGMGLGALRRLGAQTPAARQVHPVLRRVADAPGHVRADHNHLEAA
jgi:hypothetical protein